MKTLFSSNAVWIALVGACLWAVSSGAQPDPYGPGWSVQHHDSHNSDFIPMQLRNLVKTNHTQHVKVINRWFTQTNSPSVCIGGSLVGYEGTNAVVYITTGKVNQPNLWAIRMEDGALYWSTSANTNMLDPGPDACAITMPPILDNEGNLYLSDCHYIYCFSSTPDLNAEGKQRWKWRTLMPNLKVYSEAEHRWYRTNDISSGTTLARPYLSFQFTPQLQGTSYLAGITVDGEVYAFDRSNGTIVAEAYIETNILNVVETNSPCDPYIFAANDDPMRLPPAGKIFMGIWCTGSNTDDPDQDYFMNPCNLNSILDAGTFGTGSLLANNPCIMPDPSRSNVARIYVCGASSEQAARLLPGAPRTNDAMIYRVDFDPTLAYTQRLQVMNYVMTNRPIIGLEPVFKGRMPDGINSASTPDLSSNERWLFCADKLGNMYCFDTETGDSPWVEPIGDVLGSPTTFQNPDTNGHFTLVSFGNYNPWFFRVDENTGLIVSNAETGFKFMKQIRFSELLTNDYWRTDDPAYAQIFTNFWGQEYEKVALGASIIVGASNKVLMLYSMGWHNPIDPSGTLYTIPTHTIHLFVDLEDVWTTNSMDKLVDAAYFDTNGTSEAGTILCADGHNRGVTLYLSQSTSLANFLAHNMLIPPAMNSLFMPPIGGIAIVELPFLELSTVPEPVINAHFTNDTLAVSWTSETGVHYAVESSSSLEDPTPWQERYQHKAFDNEQSWSDFNTPEWTNHYYRVRALP